MAGDSFGTLFRVTTWGESHGPALGCVVEGTPPGMSLNAADIQPWLDLRRPGTSRFVTQRREADEVQILSGVFEGRTTGTALSLMIQNTDQRSKDYNEIAHSFRPGHADYTGLKKYGIRDHRGGGRASARETAARVAAGAVARKALAHILGYEVDICAAVIKVGPLEAQNTEWNSDAIRANPFFCPDSNMVCELESYMDRLRKAGSSIGAVIEVRAGPIPPGLGEPVFDKLDADLAKGLMSINAVKSVEIGAGLAVAEQCGEDNADAMSLTSDGRVCFSSNKSGGVLGGMSTGNEIVARIAIKPTSSILTPIASLDSAGNAVHVSTKGRHDPCVALRAPPIAEAMVALTLTDHLLRQRGQMGLVPNSVLPDTQVKSWPRLLPEDG